MVLVIGVGLRGVKDFGYMWVIVDISYCCSSLLIIKLDGVWLRILVFIFFSDVIGKIVIIL